MCFTFSPAWWMLLSFLGSLLSLASVLCLASWERQKRKMKQDRCIALALYFLFWAVATVVVLMPDPRLLKVFVLAVSIVVKAIAILWYSVSFSWDYRTMQLEVMTEVLGMDVTNNSSFRMAH